jgi:hypothetical protein
MMSATFTMSARRVAEAYSTVVNQVAALDVMLAHGALPPSESRAAGRRLAAAENMLMRARARFVNIGPLIDKLPRIRRAISDKDPMLHELVKDFLDSVRALPRGPM